MDTIRVRVGGFDSLDDAKNVRDTLNNLGFCVVWPLWQETQKPNELLVVTEIAEPDDIQLHIASLEDVRLAIINCLPSTNNVTWGVDAWKKIHSYLYEANSRDYRSIHESR